MQPKREKSKPTERKSEETRKEKAKAEKTEPRSEKQNFFDSSSGLVRTGADRRKPIRLTLVSGDCEPTTA